MGLSALAGPVSNLILAIIFIFIGYICALFTSGGTVEGASVADIAVQFFINVGYYNVLLALFNLIPFPPLDGSRILTMFLPDKLYYRIMQYERYIVLAVFALILMNVLDGPIAFLTELIESVIFKICQIPFI